MKCLFQVQFSSSNFLASENGQNLSCFLCSALSMDSQQKATDEMSSSKLRSKSQKILPIHLALKQRVRSVSFRHEEFPGRLDSQNLMTSL